MTKEQEDILARLYTENYDRMFFYAKSTLNSIPLAEEAVQDVFRIACMKPEQVCGSPSPKGWLLKSLRFVLNNMVRSQARASLLVTRCIAHTTVEDFVSKEDELGLDTLYGKLARTDEFQLILGVSEGKTVLELAKERNIGIEACKKRVQRARKFLKKTLSEQ